jgi:molybdopterin molybdotransferase
MPEFLKLLSPDQARFLLLSHLSAATVGAEDVDAAGSLHRVVAEDVTAPHALPEFPRASVDGYAVRAEDTYGASDGLPAYLRLVGEIEMGKTPPFGISKGECALIHTGGMLPPGANAAVMLEHTQEVEDPPRGINASPPGGSGGDRSVPGSDWGADSAEIEVLRPAAVGENIIDMGEDVTEGQVVISRGTRIGAAQIGGLMALGVTRLRVAKKPRTGIISSGDEVIDPHERTTGAQVRDVNSYSLAALVETFGGEAVHYGIVPDDAQALQTVAAAAAQDCALLLISGGSSASVRDTTWEVIQAQGKPGVLVHGINIRPGKPTILGAWGNTAVIGLPGNPVSALVIGYLFVRPVLAHLTGSVIAVPDPVIRAHLTINLASQAGREDWWPVRLTRAAPGKSGWLAEPIFGKSNLIFTVADADGLLCIPPEANGLDAGQAVDVHPL